MKAKDGQPGVNGKDGITRIVYEDNSKNTHEVATLDDGMKYAGDDAQGADNRFREREQPAPLDPDDRAVRDLRRVLPVHLVQCGRLLGSVL